jgi:hypothetical protein
MNAAASRGKLNVFLVCERFGKVRDAFIARGHNAVSCDIEAAPGPHWQGDVVSYFEKYGDHLPNGGGAIDILIGFPPCTYLTTAAEWAYTDGPYHQNVKPGTLVGASRRQAREQSIQFVRFLMARKIGKKAFENPRGVLSTRIRKPDQTIQPHEFGADASKATCLWLEGLPKLIPTDQVPPRITPDGKKRWANQTDSGQNRLGPSTDRAALRGMTYPGIAEAMATQWG